MKKITEKELRNVSGGATCTWCWKNVSGNMTWHIIKHFFGF